MIRFVCFDLNGTIISNHTWYELNMALGVTPEEDKNLMDRYRNGICSYKKGQKELEALYKKHGQASKSTIISVLSKYTYITEALETISYIQSKGYRTALLSNSIDLLVNRIASELHIPIFSANNSFSFDTNGKLTSIVTVDNEIDFKWRQIQRWCSDLSIRPTECAYIGDGEDDREVFIKTKHGITFQGSTLSSSAWRIIRNYSQLRSII